MILSAIAAMAQNRVIGVQGHLPWDLPEDMQYFKDMTVGKVMVMGRKTFQSFPKPLPRRHHIVISRQPSYYVGHPMVEVVPSMSAAVKRAHALIGVWPEEVMVIGGAQIYQESLPFLQRIYLTVIEKDFEGDTKFPEFDDSVFKLKESRPVAGPLPFSFRTYQKDTYQKDLNSAGSSTT